MNPKKEASSIQIKTQIISGLGDRTSAPDRVTWLLIN